MTTPLVRITNVEMIPISKIVPHPKNPNYHSPEQIERIAEIIEFQGWRYPGKVSKRSGFLTAGHGRLEACKLRGWTHMPINRQDYDDEAQEYADIVSDNAIAEWAVLDLQKINTDIIELGPDFDVDMLGLKSFSVDEAPLPEMSDGDRNPLRQMAFQLTEEQEETCKRAVQIAKGMGEFGDTGSSNSNGNALARIAETFITQHGPSEADRDQADL